jgi:MFS family permease
MDYGDGILSGIRSRTRSHTGHIVINWEVDDPDNPHNWSTVRSILAPLDYRACPPAQSANSQQGRKAFVVLVTVLLVLNSTMSSALPSMAIPSITADYGITDGTEDVLPISVFLVGYIFGPLIWGPLTEHYGRRNLTVVTFVVFTLFTLACALAPSWGSFLVFRMVCGACAGAPIAIVAGILADVFADHRSRGRAYAVFMVVSLTSLFLFVLVHGW